MPGKAAFIAQGPGTVQPVSLAGFAKISVLTNNLFYLHFRKDKRPTSAKNTPFTSSLYVITLNLTKAGLTNPSSRPFFTIWKICKCTLSLHNTVEVDLPVCFKAVAKFDHLPKSPLNSEEKKHIRNTSDKGRFPHMTHHRNNNKPVKWHRSSVWSRQQTGSREKVLASFCMQQAQQAPSAEQASITKAQRRHWESPPSPAPASLFICLFPSSHQPG